MLPSLLTISTGIRELLAAQTDQSQLFWLLRGISLAHQYTWNLHITIKNINHAFVDISGYWIKIAVSRFTDILYEHLATFRIQIKEKKIFPHYDNEKPNPCGISI